jgi:hypothetical protein
MAAFRTLYNAESGAVVLRRADWRTSFWGKFRGLMLRRALPDDEGVVFAYRRESVAETSIHMFFMRMPIAVVWLDSALTVVDVAQAKPWRPAYVSKRPAQYVIEAPPALLTRLKVGDKLRAEPATSAV